MSKRLISLRPLTAALLFAGTTTVGATSSLVLAQALAPDGGARTALEAPQAEAVSRAGSHASLADMVEAVGPSVVQIDAEHGLRGGRLSPFGPMATPRATGSGFIIDKSGIVITNNHVIDGASRVRITLSDGREYQGRLLGRDPKTDLAVIRIEGRGPFTPVRWGDSRTIRVGESVFAVGSPFGLGNSVTAGILSARGREIGAGPYDDFLQVDAAINSGNSGGPLFDARGRVVGVNTAIVSPSGGNVGVGFAIPAHIARNVAHQIVEKGSVSRGRIGVALQEITPALRRMLELPDEKGALIAQVERGGPAASSGLRSGDVVRTFSGKPIDDSGDLARLVAAAPIGSRPSISVLRRGQELSLKLLIGAERGS